MLNFCDFIQVFVFTRNHHLKAPSNFIAGCPKAALLIWFFVDFKCGVLLFMVILVIYKYKNM